MIAKPLWLIVGALALGVGITSCSTVLGCHNPTGYCGANTPDHDRIGGPSWFLSATPNDRTAYYRERCIARDALRSDADVTSCANRFISQNAHQYCVLYYLPPTRPKDEAEVAARERNFEQCKRDVLAQHDL